MTERLFSFALAVALLTGCVPDNTASVQPYAICAMPDDCTFSSTCGAQTLAPLVFDPTGGIEMLIAIEMHNQLLNNAIEGTEVNTHDAHLESYTVAYGDSAGLDGGTVNIPAVTQTIQQVIPAEGSSVVAITPFPQALLGTLSAVPAGPDYWTVNLTVTFRGRYEDGSSWEAPFDIPVRLCSNCIAIGCENPGDILVGACPNTVQEPHGAPVCVSP